MTGLWRSVEVRKEDALFLDFRPPRPTPAEPATSAPLIPSTTHVGARAAARLLPARACLHASSPSALRDRVLASQRRAERDSHRPFRGPGGRGRRGPNGSALSERLQDGSHVRSISSFAPMPSPWRSCLGEPMHLFASVPGQRGNTILHPESNSTSGLAHGQTSLPPFAGLALSTSCLVSLRFLSTNASSPLLVVVLLLLRLVLGRPVKPAPRVVPDAERKQACVSWSDPIAHLVLRLSVPTHLVNRLSTSAPSIIASNADCDLFPLRQYTTTRSSRLGLRNPYVRSKSSGWSLIASGRTERGRPSALGILPCSISLYSRTSRIVTS